MTATAPVYFVVVDFKNLLTVDLTVVLSDVDLHKIELCQLIFEFL